MMTKASTSTFTVRGPQWTETVVIDESDFADDRSKYIEIATRGMESQWKTSESKFRLGPVVEVKQKSRNGKSVLVNTYWGLLNSSIPLAQSRAEMIRENYKAETGQDLQLDTVGFTETK